jgi:DNA-binding NarL/FixJ family response regulator
MTIAILDPSPEDRTRAREALAGEFEGPFVEIDPTRPMPDAVFAEVRLALLETDLPGQAGSDLLTRLRMLRPDLRVVVVSRRVEPDCIVAAMKAGACDHVGKDRLDRLPAAVREALAGPMPTHARLRAAGVIAHDLRNVFQSIRLAADLLRRFPDEERRVPLLDTVATSIGRGRDLLEQLMVVARGEETPP